jgi:tetratricopeptide (TPR) repeat protein
LRHFHSNEFHSALEDFQAALNPPKNLRAEQRGTSRRAEFSYWSSLAQAALGNTQLATNLWKDSAESGAWRGERSGNRRDTPLARSAQRYYQALARQKLGATNAASETFRELISSGESALKQPGNDASEAAVVPSSRERCAAGHYSAGLGYAGLGEMENARKEFVASLELLPDHLGAKLALETEAQNYSRK